VVVSKAKTQRKFTFTVPSQTGHLNEAIEMKTFQNGNCVADLKTENSMENMHYASFAWRLLAFLIDAVILTLINYVLDLVLAIAMTSVCLISSMKDHTAQTLRPYLSYCFGMLVEWLYFATMESSPWQASFGKKACGLTVTDTDGKRLSFGRASGRYWATYISTLTCMAGWFMAAFTARNQALHDIIAKTVVLRKQN